MTLEYVPGLEKEINFLKLDVVDLKQLVTNQEKEIGLHIDKFTLLSDKYKILDSEYADYKKLKEKSFFAKAFDFTLKVGGGIAAGFVIGHLMK